jgi:hypothetical protein
MTKTKTTKQLADAILTPLIKHCSTHQGARKEVAELFNRGLSSKVRITTINKWIQADEKKRIEPAGGSLLRLLEVWISLRGKDCENAPANSIYCVCNGHTPSRNGLNCVRCGRDL